MTRTLQVAPGCCSGEDWCAVTCTSRLLSRKWHTAILQRLFTTGPLRFQQLADRIEGISAKMLTESLDDLVGHGLIERTVVGTRPRRVVYRPSEAGSELEPLLRTMEAWGRKHLQGNPQGDRIP